MTERSVVHASFTLERTYDAPPARVFAAWADPAAKARWFARLDRLADGSRHTLDFRVGGLENFAGNVEGGPVYSYMATIQDIVPDERIVSTYEMQVDGKRMSVTVATVQLTPEAGGTRLTLTEQGAFLDGLDKVELREQGTRALLDALGRELAGQKATA